jgi:hypothetical protein
MSRTIFNEVGVITLLRNMGLVHYEALKVESHSEMGSLTNILTYCNFHHG